MTDDVHSRSMSGWISDQVKINDMCCQIQLIINSNYCIKYDSHAYIVYVKNKYKKMCRQPKGYQYQNKCRLPSNFSIGKSMSQYMYVISQMILKE